MPVEKPSKREKFVTLAENRTANAIRAIRVIGNLSNRSHYEFTDGDIRKIASALSSEVDALKRRFVERTGKAAVEFKL
ncbi:hypothetical protein BV97_05662 [Novosphingobium resinovorum]|uniref:Uncharacterized protein n=1 Tax=Novosphingobium resinovorum TaxID=158500 RepID=A0A031J442_9SPHN|nr:MULTISPECIES: hypothetical protein [Novosphingobium]EZP68021.1 hypothetical protein BV97_05662 [Novosphingobium resinovorum]